MSKPGLILVCLAISCSTLFGAEKITTNTLAASALKAYRASLASYEADRTSEDEVYQWSTRVLKLELRLAGKSKQPKIAVFAQHLDRMEKLHKWHTSANLGSDGPSRSNSTVKFYLEEAKFMLDEQREAK